MRHNMQLTDWLIGFHANSHFEFNILVIKAIVICISDLQISKHDDNRQVYGWIYSYSPIELRTPSKLKYLNWVKPIE